MNKDCAVLIMAAGKGSRMNSDIKKQYIDLNGRPVLSYTLEKFDCSDKIDMIVIVCPVDDIKLCTDIAEKYCIKTPYKVVSGGKERYDSVYNGLMSLSDEYKYVMIQDGVRPFVDEKLIDNIYHAVKEYGAAIPAVKVKDTTKTIDENGFVKNTIDRNNLVAVQTPQAFILKEIKDAYEKLDNKENITDDSSIAEIFDTKVKVIEGSYKNIKITTKEDIIWAESILNKENSYEEC